MGFFDWLKTLFGGKEEERDLKLSTEGLKEMEEAEKKIKRPTRKSRRRRK